MMFDIDDLDPDEIEDERYNPARLYQEQEVVRNVTEVFGLLRDVTLLHVLGGYTLAEVAEHLSIKRSTAERCWAQARLILREHL